MLADFQSEVCDESLLPASDLERVHHDLVRTELANGDNAVGRNDRITVEVNSVLDAGEPGGFSEEGNTFADGANGLATANASRTQWRDLPLLARR